jgi:hypothetical protein
MPNFLTSHLLLLFYLFSFFYFASIAVSITASRVLSYLALYLHTSGSVLYTLLQHLREMGGVRLGEGVRAVWLSGGGSALHADG